MDTDKLFEYLVVTDQVDEFLGLKEDDEEEEENDQEIDEEETDFIDEKDNEEG